MSLLNASPLVFDDSRYLALQSPGDREMFLFKWLSLDAHLESATTREDLKHTQERLELVLLEIATIPSAANTKPSKRLSWLKPNSGSDTVDRKTILGSVPKPSRLVRDLIAKCLARIYEIGQVHRMGDALYAIQTCMSTQGNPSAKLSSLVCAGVLFEALSSKAGFRLLSCFNDFVGIGLKIIRSTNEPVNMRVEATRMLAKLVMGGGGKTATDGQIRDLIKGLRANLVHKSPMLVMATAGALESLALCTVFLKIERSPALVDIEQLITGTLIPLLATPVLVVRRALARLVAVLISQNVSLAAQQVPLEQRQRQRQMADIVSSSVTGKHSEHAVRAIDRVRAQDAEQRNRRPALSADVSTRNSFEGPSNDLSHTVASSPEPALPMSPSSAASRHRSNIGSRPSETIDHQSSSAAAAAAAAGSSSSSSNRLPDPATGDSTANINNESGLPSLLKGLQWLSASFVRSTATRELRAGVIDAYAALFDELGTDAVEMHYRSILQHVLLDLASSTQIPPSTAVDPRSKSHRQGMTHAIGTPMVSGMVTLAAGDNAGHDACIGLVGALDARAEADCLALRNMCGWLLRVPLAQKLLTQSGKLKAARTIWSVWLAGELPPEVKAIIEGNSAGGRGDSVANLAALAVAGAAMPWRTLTGSPIFADSPTASSTEGGGELALLVALHEWTRLIEDLGDGAMALDVFDPVEDQDDDEQTTATAAWMVPLENWLGHPNEAVRIAAAAALRDLLRANHRHAFKCLAALISRFQRFCAHCAVHANAAMETMKRCLGYAYAISAVVSLGSDADTAFCIPLDLVEWVHSIATRLLNTVYARAEPVIVDAKGNDTQALGTADPANVGASLGLVDSSLSLSDNKQHNKPRGRRATDASLMLKGSMDGESVALQNMRMNAGWTLLSALTSLGPRFVQQRARSEWLHLWTSALPPMQQQQQRGNSHASVFVTADMPWPDRAHQLQSRCMALSHLLAFLQKGSSKSSTLSETDLKTLVSCIRATMMFADNALDAPPPPLPSSSSSSSPGSSLPINGRGRLLVDPARPMWLLPVSTAILVLHLQIRSRIVECLRALNKLQLLASVMPAAIRLVEQTIASADNLSEIHGQRIGTAFAYATEGITSEITGNSGLGISPSNTAVVSPNIASASSATVDGRTLVAAHGSASGKNDAATDRGLIATATCLRGFRSGPWGYEIESGITSLLSHIIDNSQSKAGSQKEDLSSSSNRCLDTSLSRDFGTSAFSADEFDWMQTLLCDTHKRKTQYRPPRAPYTHLIDRSIELLGCLFPSMSENAQLTLLDSLVMRLNCLPFNSHRYIAVLTNILAAVYYGLAASSEVSPRVARAMVEMTRAALILPSPSHRKLAGEIIGLLATRTRDVTTAYLPYLLDHLTQQAIRSRDRFARAGAAVALGTLYSRAGSIVAGGMLKQVVALLHSLASDKDPIVHTWAIAALADAAMSAGYMFEPYARDTFQLVLKLFLSDSHAIPLYSSSMWSGGREHTPPGNFVEGAGSERILPVRTAVDLLAWSRQAAGLPSVGGIVATGRDAAITHPNSTTHHGRTSDEHHGAQHQQQSQQSSEGDYRFVCARCDVDAFDARAALGHLVSSLILVFGPELQIDNTTRDSVLTLISELRRSLPSIGVSVPMLLTKDLSEEPADLSIVVDSDARWQTSAEYIFAVQKQLLFFPPRLDDPSFIPRLIRQTLLPIIRTRRISYYGNTTGLHSLQRVAVHALEGILRLYGEDIVLAITSDTDQKKAWADWSLCHVVWESLALYTVAFEQRGQDNAESVVASQLISDLQRLLHTAVELAIGCEYGRLTVENGDYKPDINGILDLICYLCAVFTGNTSLAQAARPFNSASKTLAAALLISILDMFAQVRPIASTINQNTMTAVSWRKHPLTPLLAEMLRAGYLASTMPTEQSWRLCCLGQSILQRLLAQFSDVEDPAMPGENLAILAIYQAQISSAFLPALSADSEETIVPMLVRQAAMDTAAAYVISGLVYNDRATLVRILRLVAPQILFDKENNDKRAALIPAQMLVALRLATLNSWSNIFCFAYRRNDQRLLEIVDLHFGILGQAWIDAIRDTAALEMNMGDVFAELERIQKNMQRYQKDMAGYDIGVGLSLGLESTYVGLVRDPLSRWYAHYLPRFVEAVSLAIKSHRLDHVLEQAGSKQALLLLGYVLHMLTNVTSSSSICSLPVTTDLPPVCSLVQSIAGSFIPEKQTAAIFDAKKQYIVLLLETVGLLLDNGVKYQIASAFVPATAGGLFWLAQEIWTRSVSKWLNHAETAAFANSYALGIANSLLSLLAQIRGKSRPSMLLEWLFELDHISLTSQDKVSDSAADIIESLGLSSAGQLVFCDTLNAWNKNIGNKDGSIGLLSQCLNVLACVSGSVCLSSDNIFKNAARNLVSLWLALWTRSLQHASVSGINDSRALSNCLFKLFESANQATSLLSNDLDDLVSKESCSSSSLWIGKMVNDALCQILHDCQSSDSGNSSLLLSIAFVLSSDSLPHISLVVQQRFVEALACHLTGFIISRNNDGSNNEKRLLLALQVFDALAESQFTLLAMPQLARECIPVLARLVYLHMDSIVLQEKLLTSLAILATSKRYPQGNNDSSKLADMAMAAVLMLLLSMLPDDFVDPQDQQDDFSRRARIVEAILGLATAAPIAFKSILLRLAATQPIAKKRLEAAIRSRASALPSIKTSRNNDGGRSDNLQQTFNDSIKAVDHFNEVTSTKISLKSSFDI